MSDLNFGYRLVWNDTNEYEYFFNVDELKKVMFKLYKKPIPYMSLVLVDENYKEINTINLDNYK